LKAHKGKDKLSEERRSENMRRIKSKNTKPEVLLRSVLHRMGYRFRIHVNNLPGKPDIVFPSRKKVIFVHGCFWHMHPDNGCVDARLPNSRKEYWIPKLNRTKQRDREHIQKLTGQGWTTLVIWECELKRIEESILRISKFLDT
jgi:DNA mismatch endonuclease (patch repair protein)